MTTWAGGRRDFSRNASRHRRPAKGETIYVLRLLQFMGVLAITAARVLGRIQNGRGLDSLGNPIATMPVEVGTLLANFVPVPT
jgi:hypothetical protein